MARCKSPRKGIRRPPPKEAPDDDAMSELTAVIAENKLDNNATNWFKIPWRDGWNAIDFGCAVVDALGIYIGWLHEIVKARQTTDDVYWHAQDLLGDPNPMVRATLRCLQVLLSKSDGGGAVYNAILMGPIDTMTSGFAMSQWSISDLVLEHRCRDAIGTTAVLQNDNNDRLRRAFTTAWNRGLYLAAYSLPPALIGRQLKVNQVKLFNAIAVFDVFVVAETPEEARAALVAWRASGEPNEDTVYEVSREPAIRKTWRDQSPLVGADVSDADFETLKGKSTIQVFDQLYKKAPKP